MSRRRGNSGVVSAMVFGRNGILIPTPHFISESTRVHLLIGQFTLMLHRTCWRERLVAVFQPSFQDLAS